MRPVSKINICLLTYNCEFVVCFIGALRDAFSITDSQSAVEVCPSALYMMSVLYCKFSVLVRRF